MKNFWTSAALLLALWIPSLAGAAGALGPAGLRTRHAAITPQLANNVFGGPLVLQSEETAGHIDGEVFAVLEHPFSRVSAALSDPGQWCEILILHINTKYCRRQQEQGATVLDVRVGKKGPQAISSASKLAFQWRPAVQRPDYLATTMDAPDGPYDTHDYRILAEAIPLDANHTFLHMGYATGFGGTSELALKLYLATVGRDKVGFTRAKPGSNEYVGGMRGIVERNTMRYYLAIDAYLDSLAAPPAQQLDRRLQAWYDATEKYPRQLHEVDREAYLGMKRSEVDRQTAAR